MRTALRTFGGEVTATATWRRRLSAMVGTVAVIGGSAVLTAAPAHADTIKQTCGTYHLWTECISYDFNTGNVSVNAHNGYSTAETESLTMIITPVDDEFTEGYTIPAGGNAGFSEHEGFEPSGTCYGYIDSILVVSGDL